MGHGHHHEVEPAVIPVDKKTIAHIWKIAGLLGVITAIEFLFAFTMPKGMLLNFIFIALTLVKAFYIMAEFMHLGHEEKGLIWSIITPLIFVGWLILALLIESSCLESAINNLY